MLLPQTISILLSVFLIAGCASNPKSKVNGKNDESPPRENMILVMKAPDGDEESFKGEKLTRITIDKTLMPILDISKKEHLCDVKNKEATNLELVETELELQTLVDALQAAEKPRELNVDQKVFLAQVPYCDPFLLNLNVINKLLAGWDFVSLKPKD